jgi:hypothetical protein
MMNKLMNLLGVSSQAQVQSEGVYVCKSYVECPTTGELQYCENGHCATSGTCC